MQGEQPQPEYCDCEGFHNGSCHQRRNEQLDKLCNDLEQALVEKENRIAILEKTCNSVCNLLNQAMNDATIVQIARAGELASVVSNAIQDLDCVLRGEGARICKDENK